MVSIIIIPHTIMVESYIQTAETTAEHDTNIEESTRNEGGNVCCVCDHKSLEERTTQRKERKRVGKNKNKKTSHRNKGFSTTDINNEANPIRMEPVGIKTNTRNTGRLTFAPMRAKWIILWLLCSIFTRPLPHLLQFVLDVAQQPKVFSPL